MFLIRVNKGGEVTIPKHYRNSLGLKHGDQILVEIKKGKYGENQLLLTPLNAQAKEPFKK